MFLKGDQPAKRLTREVLRRAVEGERPDVSRLVESTPQMMAEARRRRLAKGQDFFSDLAALAGRTVPRLAAVTALLLLVASAVFFSDQSSDAPVRDFRSLILASEAAQSDDLILQSIASSENDNG